MIPFLTACSKAIDLLLEEEDVTTTTLAEDTENDMKNQKVKRYLPLFHRMIFSQPHYLRMILPYYNSLKESKTSSKV